MQLGVEGVRSRLKGLEGSGSSPDNSIYEEKNIWVV